jgi:surface protein
MKTTHHNHTRRWVALLACATILSCTLAPSALAESSAEPPASLQEKSQPTDRLPIQDAPSGGNDAYGGVNTVGPQTASCNLPGRHTWEGPHGGGTLVWNEHVDGDDCVLELESGVVPSHDGTASNNAREVVPWYGDSSVTKLVVDDNPADPVTLAARSGYALFFRLGNLRSVDVRNLDTHNEVGINSMFAYCYKITEVDVTPNGNKWNASKFVNIGNMFLGDISLKRIIGIEQWDTPSLTDTYSMFFNCQSLESLDISGPGWTTRNITTTPHVYWLGMSSMLEGCPKLQKIKVNQNTINLHLAFKDQDYHSHLLVPVYADATGTQWIHGEVSSNITATTPTWLYLSNDPIYDADGGTLGPSCRSKPCEASRSAATSAGKATS